MDEGAKFRQRHWVQPLQPQGQPPESFSVLERSISPQTCKLCHQPQYALWKGSLHASSASKLVRWNVRTRGAVFQQSMQKVQSKLRQDDLTDDQRAVARKQLNALTRARSEHENSCSVPQVTRKLPEAGLLIQEYTIGRQLDLGRLVEEWDHRIAPGGAMVMTDRFPPQPEEKVTLQIDVVPRDDYEQSLRKQLAVARRDPAHADLDKLQSLLAHAESLRYRLIDITLPVPGSGASVKKTIREGVWQ